MRVTGGHMGHMGHCESGTRVGGVTQSVTNIYTHTDHGPRDLNIWDPGHHCHPSHEQTELLPRSSPSPHVGTISMTQIPGLVDTEPSSSDTRTRSNRTRSLTKRIRPEEVIFARSQVSVGQRNKNNAAATAFPAPLHGS